VKSLVLPQLSRVFMVYCRVFLQKSNSWPFMSQSSFISLARKFPKLHSSSEPCIPGAFSVVHVRTSDLKSWISSNQNHRCKIILIVGNSDDSVTSDIHLPETVIHAFAQNLETCENLDKSLIPIGLEDRRFGRLGLKFLYSLGGHKKFVKVLVPPMSPTHLERSNFLKSLSDFGNRQLPIDVCVNFLDWISYFRLVRKYQFVLCLEGNGHDTHRVWETLYMDSFPVLLRSSFSESIEALGYPVLLVDNLGDVSPATLESHLQKHLGFQAKKLPQLWMPYWKSRVESLISR